MTNSINLSIIIVNFNSGNYIFQTIQSIYRFPPEINFEIIVVDNNSTDGSSEKIKNEFPEVILIELSKNTGFGYANNVGVKNSKGKYILILNNDTEIIDNSIMHLISVLNHNPEYGIVSPVLYYGDGSPQISFGRDPGIFNEFFTKYFSNLIFKLRIKFFGNKFEKDVDWISGACFLIRSELYTSIGGFDEEFFLYFEDADLGKRVREKGFSNHITSKSKIIHFLGKSTSSDFPSLLPTIKRGHLYYYKKHNGKFSFIILKLYLILKFSLKRVFMPKGKEDNLKTVSETLKNIRGIKY